MTDAHAPMTKDQFVAWAEQHIRVMCSGLVACNPMVPPQIMGEVIAEAMGRCLGSMTVSPNLNEVIHARREMVQAFKRSIRDAYPAIQLQVTAPVQGAN